MTPLLTAWPPRGSLARIAQAFPHLVQEDIWAMRAGSRIPPCFASCGPRVTLLSPSRFVAALVCAKLARAKRYNGCSAWAAHRCMDFRLFVQVVLAVLFQAPVWSQRGTPCIERCYPPGHTHRFVVSFDHLPRGCKEPHSTQPIQPISTRAFTHGTVSSG